MGMMLTRRYNVDRFGYLIPHRYGNLPMVGAVATYRPGEGRFGGAVAVEEGTTNLANNPTFSGAVGTRPSGWNSDVTIQQDDFFGQLINVAELLCVPGNEYEDFGTAIAYPLAYNTMYTISFWARGTMEPSYQLTTTRGIASATWKSKPPMSLQWQRYEVTIVTASSGSIYPFWWYLNNVNDVNVGEWVRIARIQLEQKPFATSFVDGTRAGGALKYQAAVLAGESYTVSLWAKANTNDPSKFQVLFDGRSVTGNGSSQSFLGFSTSGVLAVWYQNGAGTNTSRNTGYVLADRTGWHHYALVFEGPRSGGVFRVYVDGVQVDSFSASLYAPSSDPKLSIGLGVSGEYWNGLIDELLILPYAASEEEIVSWYEAQGPLPPHPQASLQWDRQTVRPAQMVKL